MSESMPPDLMFPIGCVGAMILGIWLADSWAGLRDNRVSRWFEGRREPLKRELRYMSVDPKFDLIFFLACDKGHPYKTKMNAQYERYFDNMVTFMRCLKNIDEKGMASVEEQQFINDYIEQRYPTMAPVMTPEEFFESLAMRVQHAVNYSEYLQEKIDARHDNMGYNKPPGRTPKPHISPPPQRPFDPNNPRPRTPPTPPPVSVPKSEREKEIETELVRVEQEKRARLLEQELARKRAELERIADPAPIANSITAPGVDLALDEKVMAAEIRKLEHLEFAKKTSKPSKGTIIPLDHDRFDRLDYQGPHDTIGIGPKVYLSGLALVVGYIVYMVMFA